jgi:hypothetical protein
MGDFLFLHIFITYELTRKHFLNETILYPIRTFKNI